MTAKRACICKYGFDGGLTAATVQARLDFEDEVEEASQAELYRRMQALQQEIDGVLSTRRRGALLHNGLQVCVPGSAFCSCRIAEPRR